MRAEGATRPLERFVTGLDAVMERLIGIPQYQAYAGRAPLPSRRAAVVAW